MGSLTLIVYVPATNTTQTPAVIIANDAVFTSEKHLSHHMHVGVHNFSDGVIERKNYNNSSELSCKICLNAYSESST